MGIISGMLIAAGVGFFGKKKLSSKIPINKPTKIDIPFSLKILFHLMI